MQMTFTKNCDLLQLSEQVKESHSSLETIKDHNDGTITISFTSTLDATEQQSVTDIVNAHVIETIGTPIIEELSKNKSVDFREINYTLITPKLHPKRTFVKGELQLVEWYKEPTFVTKVLKVEIQYFRDSFDFPEYRTTTRTWYNKDGTENPKKTVRVKHYDAINKHAEIRTRRNNNILSIEDNVIKYMVATMGGDPLVAIQQGKDYLDSVVTEVNKYVKTGSNALANAINSNTTETWLDNIVPTTSITIRDYILAELS